MTRRALITGITGQDGSYLAELLLSEGYEVVGMLRRSSTVNFERIAHIQDELTLVAGDMLDEVSMIEILRQHRPTEVYNLAAQSFVPTSWSQPVLTGEVTALGVTRILDAIRLDGPGNPLLPGELLGDVRQGAGSSPDRDDPLLPPKPVWRREGLRALDHGQLSRELWAARLLRASCSTTRALAAAWSSSRER